jgi:hypothetical protein
MEKVISFYAKHFTNADKKKAQDLLESHHLGLRRKDAVQMSFFAGAIMILVFIILIMLFTPAAYDATTRIMKLYASFPPFRFTFVVVFILAATGIDIMILKKYKVNYLFIFELDPNYKITHVQFFRVAMVFMFIWCMCFML